MVFERKSGTWVVVVVNMLVAASIWVVVSMNALVFPKFVWNDELISAGKASLGPKSIGSKANGLVLFDDCTVVAVWDKKGLSPPAPSMKSSPPIRKGFEFAELGEV